MHVPRCSTGTVRWFRLLCGLDFWARGLRAVFALVRFTRAGLTLFALCMIALSLGRLYCFHLLHTTHTHTHTHIFEHGHRHRYTHAYFVCLFLYAHIHVVFRAFCGAEVPYHHVSKTRTARATRFFCSSRHDWILCDVGVNAPPSLLADFNGT